MNKLIKLTEDHYVVVDETIQPVNGYYYDSFINKIKNTNGAEYGEASHCWQITHSTQPIETYFYEIGGGTKVFGKTQQLSLQEVKELIGEVKVDIEKKALENFTEPLNKQGEKRTHPPASRGLFGFNKFKKAFRKGYNQALEDNKEKKYTEEDLLNAFREGTNAGALHERLCDYDNGDYEDAEQYSEQYEESFIKSLQPKTEWEVEWETIDNRQPCDCSCHKNPNMVHFVACCNDGWIGKVTQKLKLK